MVKRQAVITGPHAVELVEAPLADIADTDVLIRTEYSYISSGTELSIFTGVDPRTRQPGAWCAYPWHPGYSNVGRVIAVGSKVERVKEGDRVFSHSNHASHVKVHAAGAKPALLFKPPETLSSKAVAASRMAGVAYTAPFVASKTIDDWTAVFGLGAVGNPAAQIFRILGCRVIGIDPSEKRRAVARQCGIDNVVSGSPDDIRDAIRRITDGQMARIAVDAVGDSRVAMQCLNSVAKFGEVLILGTPRVQVDGCLTDVFRPIQQMCITVRGAHEAIMDPYPGTSPAATLYSKQAVIFDWISRGALKVDPMISHVLKPDQLGEAYEGLLRDQENYTGVLIDWS